MKKFIQILAVLILVSAQTVRAQNNNLQEKEIFRQDSALQSHRKDTVPPKKELPEVITFSPNPMKAVWYSALFPGLGQIYNRRYWKLPLVVGGYMGLTYGLSWNNRYYKDYSMAYRDAMDNDPNTKSYLDFLPSYMDESTIDMEWLQSSLKKRKDFYRRNRDLCIISMVGLYLLCMVDAYVDAQLYNFTISPDLSMRIAPAVIEPSRLHPSMFGLQCSLEF